jgi:hypothetical protein
MDSKGHQSDIMGFLECVLSIRTEEGHDSAETIRQALGGIKDDDQNWSVNHDDECEGDENECEGDDDDEGDDDEGEDGYEATYKLNPKMCLILSSNCCS